jgi:hypothetical protein
MIRMKTFQAKQRVSAIALTGVLALSGGFLAACGTSSEAAIDSAGHSHSKTVSKDSEASSIAKQIALYQAMDALWADHMQYTYDTVNAFFTNEAELQPTLDRLLQNQADIGNAIKPYYGEEAGDALTDLLTTHIKDAVPVLTAAKNGNQAALDKGLNEWFANANDIANFLSTANPDNWPTSATEPMMKGHIEQTTAYATDLLKGNYAKSIKTYDEAKAHMLMLADTLASGIINQFPDKF